MTGSRRNFLTACGAASAAAVLAPHRARGEDQPQSKIRTPIAVSTYSFWQFRNAELREIDKCLDLAAEWGFDGIEILHRQMENEENGYLQRLKRRAFVNGLALCGFATHQGFLSPDEAVRQKNIDH